MIEELDVEYRASMILLACAVAFIGTHSAIFMSEQLRLALSTPTSLVKIYSLVMPSIIVASDKPKSGKTMVSSGDRSAKIRTYNYPQGRVTEHRIGLTKYNLQNVMGGDIQEFIDELQLAENAEKLKVGTKK